MLHLSRAIDQRAQDGTLAGPVCRQLVWPPMGVFLATIAPSMPQFGLLPMLVLLPLQMRSGGATPCESMPELVQIIMLAAPTTHFVMLARAILFRGAGFDCRLRSVRRPRGDPNGVVSYTLARFRSTIGTTA